MGEKLKVNLNKTKLILRQAYTVDGKLINLEKHFSKLKWILENI